MPRKIDPSLLAQVRSLVEREMTATAIAQALNLDDRKARLYVQQVKAERAPSNGHDPTAPTPVLEDVPLNQIHLTRDTQARNAMNGYIVQEYAEAMVEGAHFPPVVLYRDAEGRYWPSDGHHRIEAARQVGFTTIKAEVRAGGPREAFLYACAANAAHGLRPTAVDKRHAVHILLTDEEWGQWSDREIARRCAVSHPFVGKMRAELAEQRAARDEGLTGNGSSERTYTTKHGTVATMDTSRIGRPAIGTDGDDGEDEDGEEPPDFLSTEGWTGREHAHAHALYVGLPADLRPTVADLLNQSGICVPDVVTMLEHITAMDEAQRAELVRLQTSPDAYERSCAITFALNRPAPPHPRIMLLYEVRRELMDLSRRVEAMAARYPDLPGAAEVRAWGTRLATTANETEVLIERLPKEGTSV